MGACYLLVSEDFSMKVRKSWLLLFWLSPFDR